MTTILEALKAKDESAEGSTIAKALGGTTIAEAVADYEGGGEGGDTPPSIVTLSFDANSGTGTVSPMSCVAGYEYDLPDDTGLTAPSNKTFAGWSSLVSGTTGYTKWTPTTSETLYAVWADAVTTG